MKSETTNIEVDVRSLNDSTFKTCCQLFLKVLNIQIRSLTTEHWTEVLVLSGALNQYVIVAHWSS